jgi:hypothetical protein
MYQMARAFGAKAVFRRELPAGAIAFLVAEFFYKFHSFALEALAFLATWWILSWIEKLIAGVLTRTAAADAKEAR